MLFLNWRQLSFPVYFSFVEYFQSYTQRCFYSFFINPISDFKSGLFRYSPPPALLTKILFPPLLMLSWAVWFKFLFNKVFANTCLFILTSFSKQSASWKVLEICELCALSTDSKKTYSVNTLVAAATASTWGGGIICWVGDNELKTRLS